MSFQLLGWLNPVKEVAMASPMYQLIAQDLRERVESGELQPGAMSPLMAQDIPGGAFACLKDAYRYRDVRCSLVSPPPRRADQC